MSTWTQALGWIKSWQNANPTQPKAFLITQSQLSAINAQTEGGMNAFRIYLGKDSSGQINHTVVGCISDGNGNYNDYNIPSTQNSFDSLNTANTLPLKKDPLPCPTYCSTANVLNS